MAHWPLNLTIYGKFSVEVARIPMTMNGKYRLDEFQLEPDSRLLLHDGKPLHLARLPFQVLLYLIERRDRVVTRDELLAQFWDGKDVYDDTLRKCISAIRKALNDRGDQPRFIETRWAEGYRYIGPVQAMTSDETPGARIEKRPAADFDAQAQAEQIHQPAISRQPQPKTPPKLFRPYLVAFLTVALLALAIPAFLAFRKNGTPPADDASARPALNSIAVLPLKNLSNDAAHEYLSDGVVESLITELTYVRGLKVIARNSSFAFKGKEVDVREIGQRLGVATVLEGSFRRDAETVRVTVRLVSAEDGRVLWTGDMTRPTNDLLKVQDEIGCSVAETLKTILCGAPSHKPGTGNLAAYEFYLKGRDRRLKGDPKQAAEFFQQAVNADPNYALAWAGLAEAYTVMEVNSLVPPRSVAHQARECATKAISLDASLAAPYAALGLLSAFSDRDWAASERYFQRALANNPNYAIAHAWFANTLMVQGKFAEAEAEYLRARELDPLNPGFLNNLAEVYHYWRQPDRCLTSATKALELDPSNEWARLNQAKSYTMLGRYEEALQVPLSANYKHLVQLVVFALSGRPDEARKALPLVIKSWGQTSPFVVAIAHALLGNKEAAFAWLHKAADAQQADLASLKIELAFEPLRDDPRFAELLRRVGLTH